jgi:ATP-binding cassette subfamily B protein
VFPLVRSPRAIAAGGPLVGAVRTVWRADRGGTLGAVALQLVGALSGLGLVLASHLALSAVLDEGAGASGLVLPLVLLAVTTSVSASVGVLQGLQQRLLGERVSQHVWRELLLSCAAVDLLTYESTGFLNRLERVRGNAVSRPLAVVSSLSGVLGSGIGIMVMTGSLVALAPLLVPVLVLGGVPAVLVARRAARAEFRFTRRATVFTQRRGYLKSLLSHRVTAAELRAFDAAPELIRRHDGHDAAYLALLEGHVRARRRQAVVGLVCSTVALGGALVVIVWLAADGRISLPDAGAAAVAARLLGGQLSSVFRSAGRLVESVPFLADLADFQADHPPTPVRGRRHELRRSLTVTDVDFTYPGQESAALRGVTLDIPRGQVVALVGENGSGKTTLAKVVAGLYAPGAGAVAWDGEVLGQDDLRASCSVLFQDFLRYLMSVTDNVTISDTSAPPDVDRVRATIDRVGIGAAVDRLDGGLDTVLGVELEEGSDFSGGQWQRLALARALYRDTSVVVLDEPSASLDPRAEHELFRDVRTVLDGRAAVLISHRYSSVRLADVIFVMHEGRIVERGTHEELVAADGRYAELYALQAEGYAATGGTEPPTVPAPRSGGPA